MISNRYKTLLTLERMFNFETFKCHKIILIYPQPITLILKYAWGQPTLRKWDSTRPSINTPIQIIKSLCQTNKQFNLIRLCGALLRLDEKKIIKNQYRISKNTPSPHPSSIIFHRTHAMCLNVIWSLKLMRFQPVQYFCHINIWSHKIGKIY
jgi:hypothetical protein